MTKTILITGASSGIGRVTSETFVTAGWNVAMMARRKDILDKIANSHPNMLALGGDVRDEQDVKRAFDAAKTQFGQIDVLFNNAGVFVPPARFDKVDLKDWQTSVDVNLTGMFLCAREAFRHMRANGGRIINNGSISAQTPREGSAAYTATKHAISGLTKSISLDGRDKNICCGQIDIGNAHTQILDDIIKRSGTKVETIPVQDVADAVLNMANLPLETNILTMTIMANKMPFVGRG